MTRRCFTRLVAALALACAPQARPVYAQEGWEATPVNLSVPVSTGGAIFQPKVDVDAAGNAFAIWTDQGPTVLGTGSVVRTARYDAVLGQWSSPLTLSSGERIATAVDVAVDGAGNAVAAWMTNPISTPFILHAARYDAAARAWSPVSLPSAAYVGRSVVFANPAGHAGVCWTETAFTPGLYCRRYTPGAGWAAEESVATSGGISDVAVDGTGNILMLIETSTSIVVDRVSVARFDANTSTWGAVTSLASGLSGPASPGSRLSMNAAGLAIATWSRGAVLEARRLPAGSSTWTPPVTLASGGVYNDAARATVATDGAITVAWTHTDAAARTIQAARYDPGTDTWSPSADLPGQGTSAYGPAAMDVDALGNVHVVWSQSLVSPLIRVMAARFAVSTGQWTTAANLSAINQSAFVGDVATDAAGNATTVWFQSASGFSVPQALQWLATPAEPLVSGVATTSGGLTVSFSPHAGSDPALAQTNVEYSLDGGTTWTPRAPAAPTSPLTITGLVDGTRYALQLRAVNAAGAGRASTTLGVRSGIDTAPANLRVVARSGQAITLAWTAPPAGLVPEAYVVEGGLAGSSQVLAAIPTGGPATQATITAPVGRFFVQVVGVTRGLRGARSNVVTLVTDGSELPAAPTHVLASRSNGLVALSWTQPLDGGPVTGTRIFVAGSSVQIIELPPAESVTGGPVTSTGLQVLLMATRGELSSGPSPLITLDAIAPCTAAPEPPTAFSASTQAGSVFLDWLPPSSGEAVTSYVVSVTGAFTGTLPMTARTLATAVPPGSYTVRVAAVGLCGTGAFTAPQTVVVP